jgi:hypothetical protein
VLGLREVVANDLEWVNRRNDGRLRSDQSGLLEQCHLQVGVASALGQTDAVAVDRDAAADHEVDRPEFIDLDVTRDVGGTISGRGDFRRNGQGRGVEQVEGMLLGQLGTAM